MTWALFGATIGTEKTHFTVKTIGSQHKITHPCSVLAHRDPCSYNTSCFKPTSVASFLSQQCTENTSCSRNASYLYPSERLLVFSMIIWTILTHFTPTVKNKTKQKKQRGFVHNSCLPFSNVTESGHITHMIILVNCFCLLSELWYDLNSKKQWFTTKDCDHCPTSLQLNYYNTVTKEIHSKIKLKFEIGLFIYFTNWTKLWVCHYEIQNEEQFILFALKVS